MSSSSRSVHGGGGDTPAQQTTLSIISMPAAAALVSYVFKIEGYSRTARRIGVGNSIASDVFTLAGHRWQLKYYPDGSALELEAARWISMALVLVDTYATRVEVSATFRVLKDSDSGGGDAGIKYNGCWTTLTKNCSLWPTKLMRATELVNSGYLKDDSFKVTCDITVKAMGSETLAVAVPPSHISFITLEVSCHQARAPTSCSRSAARRFPRTDASSLHGRPCSWRSSLVP
jgi:hypothetical protein